MSGSKESDRIHNKSLKSAYADLLIEKIKSGASSRVYDGDDESCEEGELGMIQDNGESEDEELDSDFYGKFKRSILKEDRDEELDKVSEISAGDDRWLDDNSTLDEDYTDEADRSFYGEGQEQGGAEEVYDDEGVYPADETVYYEEETQPGDASRKWFLIALSLVAVLFLGPMISGLLSSGASGLQTPSAMPAIQKQLNHIYSELDTREQRSKSDFDKTIKVVISQFEKKIKELLPANVMRLQNQLESLSNRVNNLSFSLSQWESKPSSKFSIDNVTEWQARLVEELNAQLPQQIPVVVGNDTSMLVLPELGKYLAQVAASLVQQSDTPREDHFLKYDLNSYVKEILSNEFQYVDKKFFIDELNRSMQSNKHEIWQEMNEKLEQIKVDSQQSSSPAGSVPQQYSNILLKKLVSQIYNTNQHQWEEDLDFATFAQGTKLLNHLTSRTWPEGNGVGPVELLQDAKYSSTTYWQCAGARGCSWAVRFKDPVYITRLSYLHGRFNKNLHMMNSAPKVISVYVKLANFNKNAEVQKLLTLAKSFKQGQPFSKDKQHIRIGQYDYSLTDNKVRQALPLPSWFIQLKPLVRSIAFEIDENYGNKRFTSVRKFIINAVTQEDLHIMESNSFPFISNEPPEYGSALSDSRSLDAQPPRRHPATRDVIEPHTGNIPSFGQDEVDAR